MAINSFGFGGANAHILLRSNTKTKAMATQDNIPRVVAVSGRTDQAITSWLNQVSASFTSLSFTLLLINFWSNIKKVKLVAYYDFKTTQQN